MQNHIASCESDLDSGSVMGRLTLKTDYRLGKDTPFALIFNEGLRQVWDNSGQLFLQVDQGFGCHGEADVSVFTARHRWEEIRLPVRNLNRESSHDGEVAVDHCPFVLPAVESWSWCLKGFFDIDLLLCRLGRLFPGRSQEGATSIFPWPLFGADGKVISHFLIQTPRRPVLLKGGKSNQLRGCAISGAPASAVACTATMHMCRPQLDVLYRPLRSGIGQKRCTEFNLVQENQILIGGRKLLAFSVNDCAGHWHQCLWLAFPLFFCRQQLAQVKTHGNRNRSNQRS